MITQMSEPYERVENISGRPITLWSKLLPGGRLDIEAGGIAPVSRVAFQDIRLRYDGLIRLTSAVPTPEPQVVEAEAKPVEGFPCPECGKVCKSELGLRGHLKSHKEEPTDEAQ